MRTAIAAVGVGFGALVVVLVIRAALGLGVPLGPDPAMWGLAAVELREGRTPGVPPLWPALLLAGSALSGSRPWEVGTLLSPVFAAGTLAALVGMLLREGVAPGLVAAAAIGAAAAPDALAFAVQVQPDALAAMLVTLSLWAAREDDRRPSLGTAGLALLGPLLLALVREHGAPMLVAMIVAITWRRSPRAALGVAALGVAVVIGAILAFDHLPGRWTTPLRESFLFAGHGPVPDYAKELEGPKQGPFRDAWLRGDHLAVWGTTLSRLVHRNGLSLLILAVGLAGWTRGSERRPVSVYAAFSPILLLLLVWSQRRHTGILLPVAWAGIAVGATALGQRARQAVVAVAVLSTLGWLVGLRELSMAARGAREAENVARWLRAQPGTWMLGGVHNEVNLHLEWTRNNPPLPAPGQPMPRDWDGAAWSTLWVAPAMPPPFVRSHKEGGLSVWRLEPEPGHPRPCTEVVIVPGPTFAAGDLPGHVDRDCHGAARDVVRPDVAPGGWNGQPYVPHEGN